VGVEPVGNGEELSTSGVEHRRQTANDRDRPIIRWQPGKAIHDSRSGRCWRRRGQGLRRGTVVRCLGQGAARRLNRAQDCGVAG
jgi:hypothetical protein